MRALLVLIFVVVPVVELAIIVQVGQAIGVWWTVAMLVAASVLGSWLMRREGARVWRRFREALSAGRVPADEVLDGALVLFGGALLVTPGFASDVLGLLLMFPPTRALVASVARRQLGARFAVSTLGGPTPASRRRSDDVVDVEVISVERAGDRTGSNGDINSRRDG